MSLIEYIGSIGGVGGVLALLMFLAFRMLSQHLDKEREHFEERMTKLLTDYNETCKEHAEIQREHTRVLAELYTYLKLKNGITRGEK